MAAGKRLVGGAIPGTGLFVHEPKVKPRERGPAPAPGGNNGNNKPTHLVVQEEQKVNSQLVEILERKCAKQRARVEEESQRRADAEAKLEGVERELAEANRRLEERDRQVADLCTAQRGLADDRLAVARYESALAAMTVERDDAQKAFKNCDGELRKFRDSSGRTETEWKDQVLRLVAEMQSAQKRADTHAAELKVAQSDNEQLTKTAQEVVLRYEEESALRLELENKCLAMEEKSRSKEQKVKVDLDAAQGKAKQSVQARERADELSRHRDEKCQQAEQQAEAAETKNKKNQVELQRLKTLCADRNRRIEELEQQLGASQSAVPQPAAAPAPGVQRMVVPPPVPQAAEDVAPGVQRLIVPPCKPSKIPAPRALSSNSRPGTAAGSRPGTAASGASAVPVPVATPMNARPVLANTGNPPPGGASSSTAPANPGNTAPGSARVVLNPNVRGTSSSLPRNSSSAGAADDAGASGRMPPGAIRRAGSMPVRRASTRSPDPPQPVPQPARYSNSSRPEVGGGRSGGTISAAALGGGIHSAQAAAPKVVAAPAIVPARLPSAGGSRPCSRDSFEDADRQIDDAIPSEPDSSDEEEILSAPVTN